jgi:protein-tyrosine phosphatase
MILTSDSDPIRVDFVPPAAHGTPGRLGLTFAPGKSMHGSYGAWNRDLAKDLVRLREHYEAKVLVTLLEEFELRRASIPDLRPAAERAGMRSIWFPIADGLAPHDPEYLVPVIRDVIEHLEAGDTVVVHCMGGLGRAGTVSACVLVARGLTPARAISEVRAARGKGALETRAQEAFVGAFLATWREAETGGVS